MISAAANLFCLTVRQADRGGGVAGNGHIHGECAAVVPNLPLTGSCPLGGLECSGGGGQLFVRLRGEDQVGVARRVGVDAGYVSEDPVVHAAEGVVVETEPAGRALFIITVPALPDGGGAVIYLEEPGGAFVLPQKRVGQIPASDFTEGVQKEGRRQKTGVQTVVVVSDQFYQMVSEGLLMSRGTRSK